MPKPTFSQTRVPRVACVLNLSILRGCGRQGAYPDTLEGPALDVVVDDSAELVQRNTFHSFVRGRVGCEVLPQGVGAVRGRGTWGRAGRLGVFDLDWGMWGVNNGGSVSNIPGG